MMGARRLGWACAAAAAWLMAGPVHAYRPFDSTDASVPQPGEFELELGPVGLLREREDRFLVAPKVIFNLGIVPNWEVVLEGRHLVRFGAAGAEPRSRFVDTGAFLKGVVHQGSLQGRGGPSVGVEVGALLPTVNGDEGVGAAGLIILSHRIPSFTIHVNGVSAYTRAGEVSFGGGLIVEGPFAWPVRPVGELLAERTPGDGSAYSGLVGAIWRAGEGVHFDLAARTGRAEGVGIWEIRAGLTWFTQLWR